MQNYSTTFLIGKGPEAVKQSVNDTFKAFPEFQLTIEDAIEKTGTLIYKWRAEVKHEGCILNIPSYLAEKCFFPEPSMGNSRKI